MYHNPISEAEFQKICAEMEQAEKAGYFDDMFTIGTGEPAELPTKEKLLNSINADMKLYKPFFLKVYGYEISFPGYAETAIKALEEAGCSKAREYYETIVAEYQQKRDAELQPVAKDLHSKWDKEENIQKRSGETRKQEIQLQNLTENELTELCKKLLQEGIITSPEQFATAVGLDQ